MAAADEEPQLQRDLFRIIRVDTEIATGVEDFPPSGADYYLDGGEVDGIHPGAILNVFRTQVIQHADRNSEARIVSIPVGELRILQVFEKTSSARLATLLPHELSAAIEPRAFMVGDRARLANPINETEPVI